MHFSLCRRVCELTSTLVGWVLLACSHAPRVAVLLQSSVLSRTLSMPSDVKHSQCIGGDVDGEGIPEGDLEYTLQIQVSTEYL